MQLKLTDEVHAKLKEVSEELKMPMAQCVNLGVEFIKKWMKENKNENQK